MTTAIAIPMVICPGIHPPGWTQSFLQEMEPLLSRQGPIYVFPAERYPAFSGTHILQFLCRCLQVHPWQVGQERPSVTFISFSAGVVGAAQSAWLWQCLGGHLQAFVALDGWGVPLPQDWPLYRLSHDDFTDWSSALLGRGCDRFFADPAVSHAELWQHPQTTVGWWLHQSARGTCRTQTTAATFMQTITKRGIGGQW